jgi:hypothetical protein
MSFEKPVKEGEGTRRQYGTSYMCATCKKPIKPNEPLVIWDSIGVSVSEFEAHLEPITRLAAQTNLSTRRQKYDYYAIDLVWHTHCAVYFGSHLVKDGLSDNKVSQTLRNAVKE